MSWKGKTIAGFEGRDRLARVLAREVGAAYVSLNVSTYRAGERVVRVSRAVTKRCLLVTDLEADGESVWLAMLGCNALRASGAKRISLLAPWIAYGRQDRPAKSRESTGGVVLGVELSRAFRKITTLDAHSRMFRKHFGGRLKSVTPRDLIVPIARAKGATAIAAPDRGAEKRAKTVARKLRLPFIQCEKKRLRPGLGGVRSRISSGDPKGHRVLLVDDMVDSGGTLAEAAKALRAAGARTVGAVVTHAAVPASVPRAKELGLGYLEVVYQRDKKPGRGIVMHFKRWV
ncbi:MAG TPA: ribose-phosphate diphosphokinase [Candidatus Methylomirabilis sp.]|nr:ribose-phosphate diphosphokinase [Candidatus Methylomirabilis sp.]